MRSRLLERLSDVKLIELPDVGWVLDWKEGKAPYKEEVDGEEEDIDDRIAFSTRTGGKGKRGFEVPRGW